MAKFDKKTGERLDPPASETKAPKTAPEPPKADPPKAGADKPQK